uniref:Uncharacterized protein n=1 Tax=Loa loa TaxID=7209 RepID=A0A1I7VXC8_LOALO
MSKRDLLNKLSFQDVDKILDETRRKPATRQMNKKEMVRGTVGTRHPSAIEIPSRPVTIARYGNMKHCQNCETVEATEHSVLRKEGSKQHKQSLQRKCSGWSSVQTSINESREETLSKKQKSIQQPLGLQKIKEKTLLDPLSSTKVGDEYLGSAVQGQMCPEFGISLKSEFDFYSI